MMTFDDLKKAPTPCKDVGTAEFYPEQGEAVADARNACKRCPVRLDCLNLAVSTFEKHGIWGGTTERERRKIRRIYKREAWIDADKLKHIGIS